MTFSSEPFPHWSAGGRGLEVRFVGRMAGDVASETVHALRELDPAPTRVASLTQRHSATVFEAREGGCGEGDGLWTSEPGLALSIVTADCVPVICGRPGAIAAMHAGWRGLAHGVIEATLTALDEPASELEAWVGPAIGPCCYEVGDDVATLVVASSSRAIYQRGTSGRPHLDLQRAAQVQLERLGVATIRRVAVCTKCHPERLWSYRGQPGKRGRNLTLAWLA